MLLENTSVGVIAFGLKKKGSKPILAIPGINSIKDEDWTELHKNPSVQAMLKKKRLVEYKSISGTELTKAKKQIPEGVYVHQDFLGMEEDDAVEIIKKCLFLPLLKDWLDGEGRPKMQRALHEQIDIAGPTEVVKK